MSLELPLLLNGKESGVGANTEADAEAAGGPKKKGTGASFFGSTGGGVLGVAPKAKGVEAGLASGPLLPPKEKAPPKLGFGDSTGPALSAPPNSDFGISTVGAVDTEG